MFGTKMPPGPSGRFYAPSPSLGGRILRFALVGAIVTAAAFVARASARNASAAGVRSETVEQDAWPWPTGEDPHEPGTSHAGESGTEASDRS